MNLEHSPAMILRTALVDMSKGTFPLSNGTWPLYVGQFPDTPDEAVGIFDTSGQRDGRTQVDGVVHSHPGIQLRIRSNQYTAGYQKSNELRIALQTIKGKIVTIDTVQYTILVVSQIGDILSLGKSEEINKRDLFSINAQLALDTL